MNDDQKLLYTPAQVAQKTSLGLTKTYELIRTGEIFSIRIGRAVRVPASALDAFCNRHEAASKQSTSRSSRSREELEAIWASEEKVRR
jgi:excisionase family DNA binding protein